MEAAGEDEEKLGALLDALDEHEDVLAMTAAICCRKMTRGIDKHLRFSIVSFRCAPHIDAHHTG